MGQYTGFPIKVVTPALTCLKIGSQWNTASALFSVDTSQVTHLRTHCHCMLDDYPALKVFQIGLGLSFCFDMSNIKTMIDSIPLHAHLEVGQKNHQFFCGLRCQPRKPRFPFKLSLQCTVVQFRVAQLRCGANLKFRPRYPLPNHLQLL